MADVRYNDDRQQIDRARKEAEALFRPKLKVIDPSLAEPPPADTSARKPRILSASATGREIAKAPISSEPQIAASVAPCAHNELDRLNRARAAIFRRQHELRAKLEAIDSELRAIDAYEAAMGKRVRQP